MNPNGSYRIVKSITEGLYREKGSKFLAYAIPCTNPDDAKTHLEKFRKENPGAVHVCFAWRFGKKNFEDRFSDDGEPSGSAGKPMFGQILSFDITNVLLVVVRYYGGTNLGVGGLVQAYKTACRDALEKAVIEEHELCHYYTISFPFEKTGEVMNFLQKKNTRILGQDFTTEGTSIRFSISQKNGASLQADLEHLKEIKLEQTGTDQ